MRRVENPTRHVDRVPERVEKPKSDVERV